MFYICECVLFINKHIEYLINSFITIYIIEEIHIFMLLLIASDVINIISRNCFFITNEARMYIGNNCFNWQYNTNINNSSNSNSCITTTIVNSRKPLLTHLFIHIISIIIIIINNILNCNNFAVFYFNISLTLFKIYLFTYFLLHLIRNDIPNVITYYNYIISFSLSLPFIIIIK